MRYIVVPAVAVLFLGAISIMPPRAEAGSCECEQEPVPPQPASEAQPRVHDPVMAKEGKTYYLFATGPGVSIRTSTDRKQWSPPERVFKEAPAWTAETIPGSRAVYWAPDISHFNRRWHLYYSVSTFGRNRSAIGLATNETLDPKSPKYKWIDHGPIFQSYPENNYNAIDPNVAFDEKGRPWLSFGSFWSGHKILPLDPKTGKPANPAEPPLAIAGRPHEGPQQPGAIEAPFIIRRGGYFYQFASFDFCCRGANSTYNIRVGRSKTIQGPYLDRDGKSMLEGGGTIVLTASGTGRWRGPGHNAIFREGRREYLVYHAYDAEDRGASKLHIEPIVWDKNGWPTVKTNPL